MSRLAVLCQSHLSSKKSSEDGSSVVRCSGAQLAVLNVQGLPFSYTSSPHARDGIELVARELTEIRQFRPQLSFVQTPRVTFLSIRLSHLLQRRFDHVF